MDRNITVLRITIIFFIILVSPPCLFAKTISPLDYGLRQAKTGEERFKILYQTHLVAKEKHWSVSYYGIREIKIAIPSNAKSIPLGNVTNFYGVTFTVTNNFKDNFYLFELSQNLYPVSVPRKLFGSYDFRGVNELKQGNKILIVEDQNPWVENRAGYNYGAIRKDILLLKNGSALNKTIAPYDNVFSNPFCKYVDFSNEQKSISNITFKRTKESTAKTLLVKVMNMNNVLLQGFVIITPTPIEMTADNVITISNCSNIYLKKVSFNQTYSTSDKSGYGITLNNVWNLWFDEIECEAAWGLFGNNNVNTVHVTNCKINRFDTHCYGRDFYFSNCEFTQYGLLQSSFIGTLEFSNCSFKNAYVCKARTDYNAYSHFSIILKNCTFFLDSRHRSLVHLGNVNRIKNSRIELRTKYSPSLSIQNSTVVLADDLPNWSLIHVDNKTTAAPFDYLGNISIDGLRVVGNNSNFMIFDKPIHNSHSIDIVLKRVDLIGDENKYTVQAPKKYEYSPTLIFNVNKDANDIYYVINSKLNYSPIEFPHYNVHFYNCKLGRIRFYNTNNGDVSTRRRYENCVLYLNDIDTNNYTLDDDADYIDCVFKPVNRGKKVVPYTMKKTSEISFVDCSSDVNDLFGPKLPNTKQILKSYKYKFK